MNITNVSVIVTRFSEGIDSDEIRKYIVGVWHFHWSHDFNAIQD